MKVIFLDVDGVLNGNNTKEKIPGVGLLGIEDEKVEKLQKIVDATGAEIILSSTWRNDWWPTPNLENLPRHGQYLVSKLEKYGLTISGKTKETHFEYRGQEILDWVEKHNPDAWVVLDDIKFGSFDYEVLFHFVQTDPTVDGLTDENVEKAIEILGTRPKAC